MRILVTGYKGFIAQNFISACPENWCIEVYDWADEPWGYDTLATVKDMDAVVHFGAISSTIETDINKIGINNLELIKQTVNDIEVTYKIILKKNN